MDKLQVYKKIEAHYRENFDTLVKIFSRFTGNKHKAEDVIQEGYTRAFHYWERFPSEDYIIPKYMRSIFNNANHDMMKEELLHGMSTGREPEPVVNCSGYPKVMLDQIKNFIMTKSKEHSKVLYLAVFDQWTSEDIAKEVNTSTGNVRQICFRFRKELKETFGWNI